MDGVEPGLNQIGQDAALAAIECDAVLIPRRHRQGPSLFGNGKLLYVALSSSGIHPS
jgi:hypothetical protein